MSAWYSNWFNEQYLHIYRHRNDEEAALQVEFVLSLLPDASPFTVLDVACGNGRHAFCLARAKNWVVGVDLSAELIACAIKKKAELCPAATAFTRADMRFLPFKDGSFNLLTSFFTSFGYFETDEEHNQLLGEWQRVLLPGGSLFIDYLNKDFVIANLEAKTERETEHFLVSEQRSISPDGKRVEKDILLRNKHNSEISHHRESVRMFDVAEMKLLLAQTGFSDVKTWGSFFGENYTQLSPRMLIMAEKNK
jgi:ubiquinone/menaquinone biosynthesis C-methylase UbiE